MLDNANFILYNVRVSKNSPIFDIWPHGQSVKTSPFHGGVRGSTPLEATTEKKLRFCSFFISIFIGSRTPQDLKFGGPRKL